MPCGTEVGPSVKYSRSDTEPEARVVVCDKSGSSVAVQTASMSHMIWCLSLLDHFKSLPNQYRERCAAMFDDPSRWHRFPLAT
ncbi:hypothetical protein PAXRUDRAFT_833741 [Paxillus rubicundulus Ve08.2h10]|uniref:Uncharacterized protein n=1 Tax=Paxillus rubicundulus Ve08.2h10 TaxID=930991 RepID=A0A0D0CWZ6_9AGAM|nr:hypothetical protein PAXRUDRAFT_833741 [Paxillus rubicundulus Ve08.2h10]